MPGDRTFRLSRRPGSACVLTETAPMRALLCHSGAPSERLEGNQAPFACSRWTRARNRVGCVALGIAMKQDSQAADRSVASSQKTEREQGAGNWKLETGNTRATIQGRCRHDYFIQTDSHHVRRSPGRA